MGLNFLKKNEKDSNNEIYLDFTNFVTFEDLFWDESIFNKLHEKLAQKKVINILNKFKEDREKIFLFLYFQTLLDIQHSKRSEIFLNKIDKIIDRDYIKIFQTLLEKDIVDINLLWASFIYLKDKYNSFKSIQEKVLDNIQQDLFEVLGIKWWQKEILDFLKRENKDILKSLIDSIKENKEIYVALVETYKKTLTKKDEEIKRLNEKNSRLEKFKNMYKEIEETFVLNGYESNNVFADIIKIIKSYKDLILILEKIGALKKEWNTYYVGAGFKDIVAKNRLPVYIVNLSNDENYFSISDDRKKVIKAGENNFIRLEKYKPKDFDVEEKNKEKNKEKDKEIEELRKKMKELERENKDLRKKKEELEKQIAELHKNQKKKKKNKKKEEKNNYLKAIQEYKKHTK